MRLFVLSALVLIISAAQVNGSKDSSQTPSNTVAILGGLKGLTDSVHHLQKQVSTPEDHQRLSRVSELIQSFRFRLMNGRIYEKSPHELLSKLVDEIRLTSPQKGSNEFSETLGKLLADAASDWEASDSTSDECLPATPGAVELVLSDLTSRCTDGSEHYNVLGCVGAATLYCHQAFPHKSNSELLGLVTDRKGNALTIACLDQSGLVFSPDWAAFHQHCRHGCEQYGTDRVCELHHGPQYAGIFIDRLSLKSLGEDFENLLTGGCFRSTKRVKVLYSLLQSADNKECRAGNPVRNYGCLKGASSYCQRNFGYTGGVVQFWHTHEVAEVACYNAFYTGDVYISRGADFDEAKSTLTKICSLDFDVDRGQILKNTPETLMTGDFNNRNSSAELRNTFRVSKTVTTENHFSHSHSLTIGMEYTKTLKLPILEIGIKLSASYTAGVSFTKINSKSNTFEHTTEVLVPPRKHIGMKALITRTQLDVPWRAVGITKLGKRVELSGTWMGVDASDFRVVLENL